MLLRTGFSQPLARCRALPRHGRARRGGASRSCISPGCIPTRRRWLVANRPIKAIGIDTASIDYGQSTLFESHRTLYERDIPAFENLTALERLPPTRRLIVALPMKIGGGSGAPLRAIAILPPGR